jgi:septation ring formation regulator EzrA
MSMEPNNIEKSAREVLRVLAEEGKGEKRFIDVSRIPLICQSIVNMGEDIREIKEGMKNLGELNIAMTKLSADFDPVRKIVYGIMAVLGLSVLGAILALVWR